MLVGLVLLFGDTTIYAATFGAGVYKSIDDGAVYEIATK
jgi:hypothetical protein